MKSYQNMALLQNLYRLKALGYRYTDPIVVNPRNVAGDLPDDLQALRRTVATCHLCDLSKSRRQCMAGHGSTTAEIMFIDAFVSPADDESGRYFSGRSGEMFRRMVANVLHLGLDDIYYTHAVKCKAAGLNRPSASECNSCRPYWRKEFELVRPKIVATLGPDAYALITGDSASFEEVRGHPVPFEGATLFPLFHPQFLLRNPSLKKAALRDLQTIEAML